MLNLWVYTLISVFIVSLISLVGVVTLSINEYRLKKWLTYLVSFSAGALLGDVFLHLLPEISEISFGAKEGLYILLGLVIFFVLERFILWQHRHGQHEEHVHSLVYLTQVGDSLHNFIDGLIIAGSFLAGPHVGIATTIAVIFHEIPQEIGNFAILLHGGWSKNKALLYNFVSALFAVLGAVIVLLFFKSQAGAPVWLLCLGAASFIYISLSDIVPQLHLETVAKKSFWQLIWFLAGIAAMALLLLLE